MKRQKAFSRLQLLMEVVITLFVAGIVVPSFVRSDLATSVALAAGSLHTINIAGMAFSYTNQNVVFAILGALVGAMAAFAVAFRITTTKKRNIYTYKRSAGHATTILSLFRELRDDRPEATEPNRGVTGPMRTKEYPLGPLIR